MGRVTGRTCGYVDTYDYYSSGYGYMARLNRTTTYPNLNDNGDSGGPVFSGSLAAGWVHGEDSSGNLYFTPLRQIVANGLSIVVLKGGY